MVRQILTLLLACASLTGSALAQEAPPRVVAVGSDLDVDSEVSGDAVVVAGDLVLGPDAVIHGDAVAILGRIDRAPGAIVDGRVLAIRSLATLDLDNGTERDDRDTRSAVLALIMGGWLLATTLVAWSAPVRVQEGVRQLRSLTWRTVVLGLLATATFFAALLAVLGLGPVWGVPLSGVVVVLFLVVKAIGLTMVGAFLGRPIVARSGFSTIPTSFDVFVGVSLLLILRLLPSVGGFLWAVISVVALGAGAFSVVGMAQRVGDQAVVRSP